MHPLTLVRSCEHAHTRVCALLFVVVVSFCLLRLASPGPTGGFEDSWRALVKLQSDGKARSIGVSNFGVAHLDALAAASPVVPAVNQLEVHPYLSRPALTDVCRQRGILVQAFTPLLRGRKMDDPKLLAIAAAIGKSPAQVRLCSGHA